MFCPHCNTPIESVEIVECPNCEALITAAPARREKNRPTAETLSVVESRNYNGKYGVEKLNDGSLFCDCLSFLYQRGTMNGDSPFMTCKHIRDKMGNGSNGGTNFQFQAPSAYQKACLKKLGVNISEHLTNAQAYYILKTHLDGQGMRYDEFKSLILEHPKVNFLPLNHFGVEFEGGLGCSKEQFKEKLAENDIESLITTYDHTLHNCKWKLASDSSVSLPNLTSVEIVSPKLSGAAGFEELKNVLKLWNETLPFRPSSNDERIHGVNSSCGTHVHVDAKYGWEMPDFLRLAKVWAKIEIPVIWYLVSKSRRNRTYCKPINLYYLEALSQGETHGDRYYSLNFEAYQRQGSIEYRIHNGTLEGKKIIPWVVFCLMITDAVKRGLSHSDFEPTFDGIMDAVGMGNSATPLIKEARSYLWGRFQHWKEDAQRNPANVPSIEPIDVANLEVEIHRRRVNRRRRQISDSYHWRTATTAQNALLAVNSVHNLASLIPSSVIHEDAFTLNDDGSNGSTWSVPSRDRSRYYAVVHNEAADTLSCSCRGFRTHRYCYHSINLARYIVTQRMLEAEAVTQEGVVYV